MESLPDQDTNSSHNKIEQLLNIVTNDLRHLDRTGYVNDIRYVPEKSKNNDIYTGTYSRLEIIGNTPQISTVKVAMKSLRQSARFNKESIKVC